MMNTTAFSPLILARNTTDGELLKKRDEVTEDRSLRKLQWIRFTG